MSGSIYILITTYKYDSSKPNTFRKYFSKGEYAFEVWANMYREDMKAMNSAWSLTDEAEKWIKEEYPKLEAKLDESRKKFRRLCADEHQEYWHWTCAPLVDDYIWAIAKDTVDEERFMKEINHGKLTKQALDC